jgi:hypothetical protein
MTSADPRNLDRQPAIVVNLELDPVAQKPAARVQLVHEEVARVVDAPSSPAARRSSRAFWPTSCYKGELSLKGKHHEKVL